MKRELIYERRQAAGRMEAVMLFTTAVALIGAILAFLTYGWWPALELFILGLIAYALSRVFDLLDTLFASIGKPDGSPTPGPKEIDHRPT
jgi:hypothetical protein